MSEGVTAEVKTMVKERLFCWAMKRQLRRLPVGDNVMITPEQIEIDLAFTGKVSIPIEFPTPSWWTVLKMIFSEVFGQ